MIFANTDKNDYFTVPQCLSLPICPGQERRIIEELINSDFQLDMTCSIRKLEGRNRLLSALKCGCDRCNQYCPTKFAPHTQQRTSEIRLCQRSDNSKICMAILKQTYFHPVRPAKYVSTQNRDRVHATCKTRRDTLQHNYDSRYPLAGKLFVSAEPKRWGLTVSHQTKPKSRFPVPVPEKQKQKTKKTLRDDRHRHRKYCYLAYNMTAPARTERELLM